MKLSLRTGARQEENFLPLLDGSDERAHIIIGTHALLYESVPFEKLGLVVIDEQHKFGVSQRARLTAREPAPDVLVMTATPIPRTLTMTVYGDLDVSIDRRDAGEPRQDRHGRARRTRSSVKC